MPKFDVTAVSLTKQLLTKHNNLLPLLAQVWDSTFDEAPNPKPLDQ